MAALDRVAVGGISGSGKSTLARTLATRLGVPHVELDAIFHQAGWRDLPVPEFRDRVAAAVAADRWVCDGNYHDVQDLVWDRATTFVWLDYARPVGTWRAVRRTAVRLVTREELWNGNREDWRNLADPGHPIWWSWRMHGERRTRYEELVVDPRWSGLDVVRLRSPRAARAWLASATDEK